MLVTMDTKIIWPAISTVIDFYSSAVMPDLFSSKVTLVSKIYSCRLTIYHADKRLFRIRQNVPTTT